MGSGDLVKVKSEEKRTYRIAMILPQPDRSIKMVIGPPTLTPRDIDLFKLDYPASIQDPRYKDCFEIDASHVDKILDS